LDRLKLVGWYKMGPNTDNVVTFKDQLEYLRVSSKNSVVDGDRALDDPVKAYLHVSRTMETELKSLLENAAQSKLPQLILLIGNVGDGKSHLLSHIKTQNPDLLNHFHIHNDATASFNKNQTYLDTLNNLLAPFNMDVPAMSGPKIILAINLGTLANFLEQWGCKYQRLKEFIAAKGIFSESIQDNGKYNPSSLFQFINLTDYHLFSLTENGPSSPLIKDLLDRITEKSENNPFYNAYSNYYKNKEWGTMCPVKFNYEFLMNDRVKNQLSKLITEAIIRFKMVVSIRSLLNFFYDVLVPVELANLSIAEYERSIKEITPETYLPFLFPNFIFNNPDVSDLFNALHKLDPVISCAEKEDSLLLERAINKSVEDFRLLDNCIYAKHCLATGASEEATKSFPRLLFFERGTGFSDCFEEYSLLLYSFLKGDKSHIKKLFEDTANALRHWNGTVVKNSDSINVHLGYPQNQYRMSSKISLTPDVSTIKTTEHSILEKFTLFIPLKFKESNVPLKIDFNLYTLIKMINRGYIPNYLDKRNHINVQQFIDRMIVDQGKSNALHIRETHSTAAREFSLHIDSMGDFSFEEVL